MLEDPIAELKQFQETDDIMAYHEKFEIIITRIDLSEEYLVSAYLAWLRMDTQMHIRMFKPRTVKDCLMLGRLYEKAHPRKTGNQGWASKGVGINNAGKGILATPKEGEFKGGSAYVKPNNKNNTANPRKFLSQEEMSERRAKGLCYFCDEKFTPEHYLQHKEMQLYSLEVDEELYKEEVMGEHKEEVVEMVEPQISVNTLSGISDYNTMRVRGTFNKRILFILIDSRSTHNFIDTKVAEGLGCEITAAGMAKASLADGRKLDIKGKISDFKWNFQ